jgi:hypothetical protein
MSDLAVKLFEESEKNEPVREDYLPLLRALFGANEFDPALNQNADFADEVSDVLMELDDNDPLGLLQRYFVEEYFLHGKSKADIGKEIAANIELLMKDLETSAVRFLRHPDRSRPLLPYIRKEQNDG